jgi:hypothetical protein
MITNEQGCRVAKAAAKKFGEALKGFDQQLEAHPGAHPRLIQAEGGHS